MPSSAFMTASWITCIISIVFSIFSYPLLWLFYSNICCNNKNNQDIDISNNKMNKLGKKMNCVSIFTFSCFIFVVNVNMFAVITYIVADDYGATKTWRIFDYFASVAYMIALHLILLVFVIRIDHTLSDSLSIFAYSSTTMKLLYSFPFIMFFIICCVLVAAEAGSEMAMYVIAFIWILMYCITWITLFILLIKKTMIIINYKLDNTCTENNIENNTENNTENTTENNVVMVDITSIDLITRYTLLIMIGFMSTVSIVLIRFFEVLFNENTVEASWIMGIDSFFNALCICLLFVFSTNVYNKLCKLCDNLMKNCFISRLVNNEKYNDQTKQQLKELLFTVPSP